MITFQNQKTDQVEKYYKAEYASKKIPATELHAWTTASVPAELAIPEVNTYLPSDLSLVANDKTEKTSANSFR